MIHNDTDRLTTVKTREEEGHRTADLAAFALADAINEAVPAPVAVPTPTTPAAVAARATMASAFCVSISVRTAAEERFSLRATRSLASIAVAALSRMSREVGDE
jgi:hypothetical protein